MFALSKVGWFLATPSNLFVILGLIGALAAFLPRGRLSRWGRRVAAGMLVLLAILGIAPVGTWLLMPLEERFPAYADDGTPLAGAIILGGGVLPNISLARGQLTLGDAGERVVALSDLARRRPDLRLVFTGGSGALLGADAPEAVALSKFGATLGLEAGRVAYEQQSRTTYENARDTRSLLAPDADKRWLLVTSAWHMPRSIGTFRAAGIDVVPYPVDYRTGDGDRWWRPEPSVSSGLDRVDIAVREYLGLLYYRLLGRSSALFPAP
ncbi:YdcF family protein [Enterovirga rhinocerotis]|uniref:Uncharacterized SAM-binding protein YcdF (DUF218 family) n=1 Tax=Enterovirga rhinocerotis TaxID=1339210 RepID=A0A4R7C798_9HYPH|nr:YdcF family protein [Enterovirga rhinocerotis]TDR94500.1 uncharacterized SAM-binding protein YcdF (DUF218 family) [Enterovirga rhinocerotis]